ncbi:MAG: ABC transporter permease [Chloroflexi bacterium]|nr:ABC transporter permease [Chloroflexota bacterium]
MRLPRSLWIVSVSLAAMLACWWAVLQVTRYPAFILPSPELVASRWWQAWQDGTLWRHTSLTLLEVLLGLLLGFTVATVLGYFLARSRLLEQLASPYIVASQAVPVVALAPLLVLWFGTGLLAKALICSLVVFFPILVNTIVGLRQVPQEQHDLMRAMGAGAWQTFVHLEIPSSLPVLIGGLKVGVTLSVIGAVVGEFVAADRGLGFLINVARGIFDTPLMFAAILTLAAIALSLYGLISLADRLLMPWRRA